MQPSWWEELDIRYFMWGGIGFGLLICLCKVKSVLKNLRYVAPEEEEEEEEASALKGKFMFCARCKNRLAVDLYQSPDGKMMPLCQGCFARKTRDVDIVTRAPIILLIDIVLFNMFPSSPSARG